MRAVLSTILAIVLLGLFLVPVAAAAAPAITLAPAALPRGGTTTATGSGFSPAAQLELFIVLPQFGGARVKLADLVAGMDGGFTAPVRLNSTIAPGPTPLVVVGGGADLAQAILTVRDGPSIAPERLAVTPGSGPAGTRFTAAGEGLAPGQAVVLFTTESAKGPQGNFRQIARVVVPADGRITVTIDSTGYSAEPHDLILFGPGGPEIGLPQAVAQFTVATAGMPNLPNTGGGYAADEVGLPHGTLSELNILGVLVLLVGVRRVVSRQG